MADFKVIGKFKQQKYSCFKAKARPGKKSLAFLFEEINALKRQLKPGKTGCKQQEEDG
jgi:hypothetical protein